MKSATSGHEDVLRPDGRSRIETMTESNDIHRATLLLLERTSAITGIPFFTELSRAFGEVARARHCFVGEVIDGKRVQTLVSTRDGVVAPPRSYDLLHSPCHEALSQGGCFYPKGVRQAFPQDQLLVEMKIESYAGIPIKDGDGRSVGILVAMDESPMSDLTALHPVLRLFALRAAAEMERAQHARELEAQKLASETLQQDLVDSENRYRQMIMTCAEGVWTVNSDGATDFVNPQMARMLGYSAEEMLGRPLFDFMDDRAKQEATINLIRRRQGISETHEFRFKHAKGHDVWVLMATNPLFDRNGGYVGAQAFVTDVTERRGLELKVQHAQKLESLGVLAGGIAHDFNNLLVGILGNVGLALLEARPEAPVVPLLNDIQTAAVRAADLTKQMLAYSGKGRFVVEKLDVNRIIEEMSHLLTSVISKKSILKFNITRTLPAVEADATQLRQVVMNLITNASDAIGERSGIITVTTGVVDADLAYLTSTFIDEGLPAGDYVFIEVGDTGVGMDAITKERIFDPFFTTKFTGRGLGLAAVLGILRSHRGAIKVYSEVGRGSTFKVLLPCAPGSVNALVTPEKPQPGDFSGQGMILICDDEETIRAVARRVVEKAGYGTITAADGKEAVRVFREHASEIVAVLLDMTMPGLNGEQVFHEMRRIDPNVKVLLSSGYNEQDATSHFVGKGLAGFIQKPWTPSDLLRALKVALNLPDSRPAPKGQG